MIPPAESHPRPTRAITPASRVTSPSHAAAQPPVTTGHSGRSEAGHRRRRRRGPADSEIEEPQCGQAASDSESPWHGQCHDHDDVRITDDSVAAGGDGRRGGSSQRTLLT